MVNSKYNTRESLARSLPPCFSALISMQSCIPSIGLIIKPHSLRVPPGTWHQTLQNFLWWSSSTHPTHMSCKLKLSSDHLDDIRYHSSYAIYSGNYLFIRHVHGTASTQQPHVPFQFKGRRPRNVHVLQACRWGWPWTELTQHKSGE